MEPKNALFAERKALLIEKASGMFSRSISLAKIHSLVWASAEHGERFATLHQRIEKEEALVPLMLEINQDHSSDSLLPTMDDLERVIQDHPFRIEPLSLVSPNIGDNYSRVASQLDISAEDLHILDWLTSLALLDLPQSCAAKSKKSNDDAPDLRLFDSIASRQGWENKWKDDGLRLQ